ncbi:HEAT repeat domain-containing protein [Leminorella grimontii]
MPTRYQRRKANEEVVLHGQYKKLDIDALIPLLDDESSLKRIAAARQLQLRGNGEAVTLAEKFCRDDSYIRRETGAFILGQIELHYEREEGILTLLNGLALYDKSARVRAAAIESTAQRCKRNPAYAPRLIVQSATSALDKSMNARRATAFALSAISDSQTVPLLIKLAKDGSGDVRNWAAFAINLNQYDTEEIRNCLVEMLQDVHQEARGEAIIGLSNRQDKRVLPALRHELERDEVYDDFIEAAGALGDRTLLPILNAMLDRFDECDVISAAINKLGSDSLKK